MDKLKADEALTDARLRVCYDQGAKSAAPWESDEVTGELIPLVEHHVRNNKEACEMYQRRGEQYTGAGLWWYARYLRMKRLLERLRVT